MRNGGLYADIETGGGGRKEMTEGGREGGREEGRDTLETGQGGESCGSRHNGLAEGIIHVAV